MFCPACGYDLRGSTSTLCSECGYDLDLLRGTASQIPWIHRQQLGPWRAYLRTIVFATFHHRRLWAEAARPIDRAAATEFRHWSVLLTWATLIVMLFAPWLGAGPILMTFETVEWLLAPLTVALLLALYVATVLPTMLLDARGRGQTGQRAGTLCEYACAPLGWAPWTLVPGTLVFGLRLIHVRPPVSALSVSAVAWGVLLILWAWNLLRLTRRFAPPHVTVLMAVIAPPLMLLAGTGIVAASVALAFYAAALLTTWV
jgi:hypothetical protein